MKAERNEDVACAYVPEGTVILVPLDEYGRLQRSWEIFTEHCKAAEGHMSLLADVGFRILDWFDRSVTKDVELTEAAASSMKHDQMVVRLLQLQKQREVLFRFRNELKQLCGNGPKWAASAAVNTHAKEPPKMGT